MEIWRTRLVWAGIGAGVTLVVVRLSGGGREAAQTAAPAPAVETAQVPDPKPALASAATVIGDEAAKLEAPLPDAAPSATPPPVVGADPATAAIDPDESSDDDTGATEPPADETEDEAVPEGAPEYPLPRMPGMTKLRSSTRFDADNGRWVLTRASRVPAPAGAVESFYRKALEELGLQVSRVDEPPDAAGTRRVTLKARGKAAKAQVTIRQPAGQLITTARVIWQTI